MITALTGKNSYLLQQALNSIIESARRSAGDLGIERLDAAECSEDDVLVAVQSLPFLAPSKLVVVQNAQNNSALMERIAELAERTANGVDVVLVGPVFDKRTNSFKTLKKHATVQEFGEPKPFELPKWVVQAADDQGARISQQDAAYLIDRVGTDQLLLENELRKIGLSIGELNTISRSDIDRMTEPDPQSTIFDMLETAFSGKTEPTLQRYRQLRQKRMEPQYIIAMLTWQLQGLAAAVHADPATEQALVAAGQSPYAARKSLALARTMSRAQLRDYVDRLFQLDKSIKATADPDAALELYLIELGKDRS